jgi:WD40-like Beta Propeller Repeat
VIATVPDLGTTDSVAVTIKPGAPTHIDVGPLDTAVLVGGSYTPRANTADRYGNRVAAVPFSVSSSAPEITIVGASVHGEIVGRTSLSIFGDGFQRTASVSVVPEGTLAASSPDGGVIFRLDGSAWRVLNHDRPGMTSWAPTGSELAYDLAPTYGYGTPVKVADMAGATRPVSVSLGTSVVQLSPSYSRAGDWVYFSALPAAGPEQFRLYRARPDGSGTEPVPNQSAEDDFYESVSPDGTRLVYVRRTGSALDYLRVLDVTTGVVSKIDVPGHSPAWSPMAGDIAYVDMRAGWVLKVMRPDGTGIRQVSAPGTTYERGLAWSPDGKWLVARNTMSQRLDLIEVATGRTIPLPFTFGMAFPAWKP